MQHFGVVMLVFVALSTGCATSRDIVPLQVDAGINPEQGPALRIAIAEDARRFISSPPKPSTPSMMDDNLTDPALRARAVARKRNAYGMALGDVILPEGQTVASIISSALTRSFREAGFRVMASGTANAEQAIPVTIRIDKFWAWMTPGFWSIALESEYDVMVTAPRTITPPQLRLSGQVRDTMQLATSDDWAIIVTKSINDLARQLKANLLSRTAPSPLTKETSQ